MSYDDYYDEYVKNRDRLEQAMQAMYISNPWKAIDELREERCALIRELCDQAWKMRTLGADTNYERRINKLLKNNIYLDLISVEDNVYNVAINGFVRPFTKEEYELLKRWLGND